MQSHCLQANKLRIYAQFLYEILYLDKAKTEVLIGTASYWHGPPEILECNHFKIQAAQLPPEGHEYFTLCKWGLSIEFLGGDDYDTVISEMVTWWW